MKITGHIFCISFVVLTLFSLNLFAEDYSQWKLPKFVKLRLGKGRVYDIKYTPDGNRVAVATNLGIWIYDAFTKKELLLIVGHKHSARTIDFPADGSFLASGSFDGTIRLWDIDTGKQLNVFTVNKGGIDRIAVAPDGKTLVSSGWETLILWDVKTGKQLKRHTKYDGVGLRKRFNNFLKRFLAGPRPVSLHRFANEENPNVVGALDFSPDGKTFATGHWDGTIRIWDGETGKRLYSIREYEHGIISGLAYAPDGTALASCNYSWVLLHTFQKNKPTSRHMVSVAYAGNLEFSPDGTTLIGTGKLYDDEFSRREEHIHAWKVDTGLLFTSAPTQLENRVSVLTISPQGDTILTSNLDGTIHSWDTKALKPLQFSLGHARFHGRKLLFSDDGKTLTNWNKQDRIQSWNLETGTPLTEKEKDGTVSPVIDPKLSYSPDGKIKLEYYDEWKKLRLRDVESNKYISDIAGHREIIRAWAFSPDNKTLATASKDMTVKLWDIETGNQIMSLRTYTHLTSAVTFSSDGKTLIYGSVYDINKRRANLISLWDIPSGKLLTMLEGHREPIDAFGFSNDGKTFASSESGMILLWDWKKIIQSVK